MNKDDNPPQWKQNPYFAEVPKTIWCDYNYIARFRGLSVERWEDMLLWIKDNVSGRYTHYSNDEFKIKGVYFDDLNDFVMFKLCFFETPLSKKI